MANLNSNTPDTTFNQDEVIDALTSKIYEKKTLSNPKEQTNNELEETETEYDDDDEDEHDNDENNLYYNESEKEKNDEDDDDSYHYSNETAKNLKKEKNGKLGQNQPKQVNFR